MTAEHLPGPRARGPAAAAGKPGGRAGWRWARRAAVAALVGGYAWVAGGTRPFQTASLVSVLIPVAVLGGIALVHPPRRILPPERIDPVGWSYWLIAVGILFEWEASSYKDNSVWWHPALTDLVNPLIATHPLRSAAIVVWLLTGWGLVRR